MFYQHEFEASLSVLDFGRMKYHVVYLDPDLVPDLPLDEHPRLRITGEVAEFPFDGAWIPDGAGRWYIIVNKTKVKEAELRLGSEVLVRFNVADQDAVELPEALRIALDGSAPFKHAWDHLTPGKQRGMAYRVASAKTDKTRSKRILELQAELSV